MFINEILKCYEIDFKNNDEKNQQTQSLSLFVISKKKSRTLGKRTIGDPYP
jgi:hypothetical protein